MPRGRSTGTRVVKRASSEGRMDSAFGRALWPLPIVFAITFSLVQLVGVETLMSSVGVPPYTPSSLEAAQRAFAAGAFSESYAEARDKFVSAATEAGADLSSIPVGGRGPAGDQLSIDIAVLRGTPAERGLRRGGSGARAWPETRRAMVHSSGVHGVELFAGSAVQVSFLRGEARTLSLADGDAVVLVHAVNPYGAAWLRRWNENGVDLNRNCMNDEERSTLGISDAYLDLNYLINPEGRLGWFQAKPGFYAQAGLVLARHGMRKLKDALVTGQWTMPGGLWYGGDRVQDGPARVFEVLASDLAGLSPRSRSLARLVHVDVHTGLGPFGRDTILSNATLGTMYTAFPGGSYGSTSKIDGSVGIGYETAGDFGDYGILRLAPESASALSVTQEFGTVAPLTVVGALRAENALYRTNATASVREWEKIDVLRAFYPASVSWRQRVLERGAIVLHQAMYWAFSQED